MRARRRAIAVALAAAIAVVVPSAVAPAISQAAAYRYWSYWLGSESGWSFANVGPAFRVPTDGTVEGWRYSVSGVEGNHAPSIAAEFASVCSDTAAEDGRKRVAVVVDPGVAADAPAGEQLPGAWAMCVVAEERATGYDVLRAAATVRAERGLICAIGGYPARGCADVVADPAPTPSPSSTPKPSKSPKPTPAPTASPDPVPTAAPGSPSDQAPATAPVSADSAAATETSSAEPSSAMPTTAMPSTSSASPDLPPTPEPSYSLLTTPIEGPPSQGDGAGGALVAGIAVVGIAGLGAAAILRMRRAS